MPSETIVAVFDTAAHAEAAIVDVMKAGVPSTAIERHTKDQSSPAAHEPSNQPGVTSRGGFWSWLTGDEGSDQHRTHSAIYDRTIASGGTVVTIVTEGIHVEKALTALEAHDPVNLEERASQYGLTGASTADSGFAAPNSPPVASPGSETVATSPTAGAEKEQVVSLSEESLVVGKREVDRGTTRIRRYVVERPVEEQIRLRDETVSVFRRPVTGTATVGADAFTDRTIEVTETDEEAVVSKSSRVVEEVVVQKGVEERVETVHDTVRREEVEITGPGEHPSSAPAAASDPTMR